MPNPVEEIASKALGSAKVVKASLKGLSGVFKHLMEEHGEVSALLKRVSMTSDPDVRREYYPKIRAELISHERGEVAEVYAVLGRLDQTQDLAARHNAEASELESAIASLDRLEPSAEEWGPAFENVVSLVQAHVQEEESEIFPKAQAALGEDESKLLLDKYEAAKRSVKEALAAQPPPVAS